VWCGFVAPSRLQCMWVSVFVVWYLFGFCAYVFVCVCVCGVVVVGGVFSVWCGFMWHLLSFCECVWICVCLGEVCVCVCVCVLYCVLFVWYAVLCIWCGVCGVSV
jgi:hypothetical protein